MSRNINLRNHIHTIFHAQTLQIGEFFLGIRTILGGQVSEGDTILLDVENGGLKAMIKPGVEVVDE